MASIDPDRLLLTPQQRLAASRRALVARLEGDDPPRRSRPMRDEARGMLSESESRSQGAQRFAWPSLARSVVRRWWRRHPANAAAQLAVPLLERYAEEQPLKLLGAAAATGSLIVLARPWRLLSITAVLAAVLKTSDVADLVTSLMQKNANPRKDPLP